MSSRECPLPAVQLPRASNTQAVSLRRPPDSTSANLRRRLLGVAGGHLEVNLPRLGILGFGHCQHQQAVAVHSLDLGCVNGCSQTQRASELRWTWIEFLPDDLRAVRRLESQRAFDGERVLVDGQVDRLFVQARRHQRSVVRILGFPDIDWQRLVAGASAICRTSCCERGEALFEQPVENLAEWVGCGARTPEFDGHEVHLSCRLAPSPWAAHGFPMGTPGCTYIIHCQRLLQHSYQAQPARRIRVSCLAARGRRVVIVLDLCSGARECTAGPEPELKKEYGCGREML